jgi:hypothetical protein
VASENSTTFIIFAGAAFISGCLLVVGFNFVKNTCFHRYLTHSNIFTFHARAQEMGSSLNPDSYQGEPMVVDSSEQGNTLHGLAFPHVVGEDGHHTVQHIDM